MAMETKEHILNAYISLCAEVGITAVTLQKVANRAELAFATVRYHFVEQGKALEWEAALYVAQTGQKFTQDYIENQRRKTGFNPLKSYLDATIAWVQKSPKFATFLIYFYYISATDKSLPIRNDELLETARTRVVSLIRESIGMDIVPHQKTDVYDLATQIHTIVFGAGVIAMSVGKREEFLKQRRLAWTAICKILG